ncbi:MAG: DMT family transporter [Pseudomonadota bacterium]
MSSLSVTASWALLLLAGLLEVVWAAGLKSTEGFSRLWPSVGVIMVAWLSFWLLGLAMRQLPAGTAYAIWVGIGAAGTVVAGIVLLGESASPARLACVGLILTGVIGLRLLEK